MRPRVFPSVAAMAAVLSTLVVVVPSAPVAAADPPVCDGEEATLYVDENGDVAGSRGTATKSGNRWTFTGTSGIDVIVGTNGPDTIKGLQGNDRICSMDGSDYVSAGPGNDRVFALGGNDTVLGGNNDDYLHGGGGDDTLKGGRGNDDLRGRIGNDTLIGGNGNDRMDGHTGADSFSPGAGTDTCLDPDSTTDFGGCENRPTFALPAPNLTSLHLTPEGRVNARWAPVANAGGYQVEWFYDVAQSADRVFLGRTSVFSGATTTDQLWPSDDRVVCARVVAVPGAEDYRASTPGNERCLGAQVEACLQVTPSTDMGQAVYAAVTQSSVLANSSVSARAMASGCNTVHDVWVNEPGVSRLYHGVHHLLSTAEHDVRMVFFDVQVESQAMTSIGLGLMDAVEALPAGRVLEVEVVIGAPLLWRNLNMFDNPAWEQFENNPKIRVVVREQNDLAAKSGTNVLHDKLIVVDGTSIVVAGANPQTSNDYPNHWFDFGVRIDGPVAVGANENFQDAWSAATDDALRNRPYTFSTIPTNGTERMVLLPRVDGIGVHGLDDTTNPQDVGFLTVFGEAKRNSTIRVMSPNIGDNNFLAAVNRALDNDVNVQILTSLDFNSFKAGLPTQGAPNCRVVRDLLEDHDDRLVNGVERFGMGKLEIRWHGLDGQAIEGKTAGAGHAKYLQYLVNDNLGLIPEVTIVGSGNQDTQAWDQSHEFNVLIEGDRAGLDQQVWRPAWGRAVEAAPFECV